MAGVRRQTFQLNVSFAGLVVTGSAKKNHLKKNQIGT
jgi:hypothetical protein